MKTSAARRKQHQQQRFVEAEPGCTPCAWRAADLPAGIGSGRGSVPDPSQPQLLTQDTKQDVGATGASQKALPHPALHPRHVARAIPSSSEERAAGRGPGPLMLHASLAAPWAEPLQRAGRAQGAGRKCGCQVQVRGATAGHHPGDLRQSLDSATL